MEKLALILAQEPVVVPLIVTEENGRRLPSRSNTIPYILCEKEENQMQEKKIKMKTIFIILVLIPALKGQLPKQIS
jgi:hypothetical protein